MKTITAVIVDLMDHKMDVHSGTKEESDGFRKEILLELGLNGEYFIRRRGEAF